jgi:translation initiation factor IF-1
MAKEEGFRMDGQVIDVLPNAMFRVKIENFQQIIQILLISI